jgi:hypothetical protein
MPTVVREDGFSIRIYAPPREHPPAHVHVHKAGKLVIIELGIVGSDSPAVRDIHGMSSSDVLRALRLVQRHIEMLMAVWEELHGEASPD